MFEALKIHGTKDSSSYLKINQQGGTKKRKFEFSIEHPIINVWKDWSKYSLSNKKCNAMFSLFSVKQNKTIKNCLDMFVHTLLHLK